MSDLTEWIKEKELPCPHCGQNLNLPARTTEALAIAWDGKALSQSTHEKINSRHYPGTRQLCCDCQEPTERCEEDEIYLEDHGPLCESCYHLSAVPPTEETKSVG